MSTKLTTTPIWLVTLETSRCTDQHDTKDQQVELWVLGSGADIAFEWRSLTEHDEKDVKWCGVKLGCEAGL